MKTLKEMIEDVAPIGWRDIDWLHRTDSSLARERAAAGLPGATRERCRQVRRTIEGLVLAKYGRAARKYLVNGLRPVNWHKMGRTTENEARLLELYEPGVRAMRLRQGKKDVAEMTPQEIGKEVGIKASWVSAFLRKRGLEYRGGGVIYHWSKVAPAEWYLLTDAEIGLKVGCANISVVAQYRDRPHRDMPMGKIAKASNQAVRTLRRVIGGLSAENRIRVVKDWMVVSSTDVDRQVESLIRSGVFRWDPNRPLAEAQRLVHVALKEFRRLMTVKFAGRDWWLSPEEVRLNSIRSFRKVSREADQLETSRQAVAEPRQLVHGMN